MGMRRRLLGVYWAMEKRLVPGLQYSQRTYEEHLGRWVPEGATWLDIGCGRRLLPAWRATAEQQLLKRVGCLVGTDLSIDSLHDNTSVALKICAPAEALPFDSKCFDLVTANMVVEHLADPEASFKEVNRVLRPGGVFVFHTPNAAAYPTVLARMFPDNLKRIAARMLDGRRGEDVFPTFYRGNSAATVRALAHHCGFEIEVLSLVSTTALFSVIPPLAFIELLWLRALRDERRREWRSNLIVALRKKSE